MTINRTLAISIFLSAMVGAGPALAQSCTRQGNDVTCDDGLASSHPSVIIGHKPSVVVGQGVFVGKGKGVVPLENPSAPERARCPVLDGLSYCN